MSVKGDSFSATLSESTLFSFKPSTQGTRQLQDCGVEARDHSSPLINHKHQPRSVENSTKHWFSAPANQQLRKGSYCLQTLKTIIFYPLKQWTESKPAPRNLNPRGMGKWKQPPRRHTERMIQRRPDLLKANTQHPLHFCWILIQKAESKYHQKEFKDSWLLNRKDQRKT